VADPPGVAHTGCVGAFNRSHYEDMLVVRVHGLVWREEWAGRYDMINQFERELAEDGTTIVKVMLHISAKQPLRQGAAAAVAGPVGRPDQVPADPIKC
jgi:polyphosphate kinase 2 (PPK2 family)